MFCFHVLEPKFLTDNLSVAIFVAVCIKIATSVCNKSTYLAPGGICIVSASSFVPGNIRFSGSFILSIAALNPSS